MRGDVRELRCRTQRSWRDTALQSPSGLPSQSSIAAHHTTRGLCAHITTATLLNIESCVGALPTLRVTLPHVALRAVSSGSCASSQ